MELRHLKHFVAVAEELHYGRAALRLRMKQSPLSRSIRQLERDLGFNLFERTTRHTNLTRAGVVYLSDVRRVFKLLDEGQKRATLVATGFEGHLRLGVAEGITGPRLTALLVRARTAEPTTQIEVVASTLASMIHEIERGGLDVGIAIVGDRISGTVAAGLWQEPMVVVLPRHHVLSESRSVSVEDVLAYPLVMCDPVRGLNYISPSEATAQLADLPARVAHYASSFDVMLSMVGADYGVGFALKSQMAGMSRPDLVVRSIAGSAARVTVGLLRADRMPSEPLRRFCERAKSDWHAS